MRKSVLLVLGLCVLSACARRPDAIVPADIPMAAYTGQSCKQLAHTLIHEQENLASVSSAQNQAATGDAVGAFLFAVPLSSTFGGEKEGQVAVAKGKVQAIDSAMLAKNCK